MFKALILAFLGAVASVGLYAFLFLQVVSYRSAIQGLQDSLVLTTERNVRLSEAQQLFTATASERASIDTYLITNDGVVPFISSLEHLSAPTGMKVNVSSVSVVPLGLGTTTEALTLSINAHGSWNQVTHLLSLIESLPYRVELSNVQLIEHTSNPKAKIHEWDIEISFNVAKLK